jgi:hypothetical protein
VKSLAEAMEAANKAAAMRDLRKARELLSEYVRDVGKEADDRVVYGLANLDNGLSALEGVCK